MISVHNRIKPIKGWYWSVFVLSATAQVVGCAGFLEGFADERGNLDLTLFDWQPAPLIYGAVLWGSWAATIVYLRRSKETRFRRIYAGTMLSIPVAVCVLYVLYLLYKWMAA